MKQKEGDGKKRETKGKRTYRLSVRRERIADDVRIIGHDKLPSKAIRIISINSPKEMWRFNGLIDSRSPLLQFPTLEVMTNKVEGKKEKKKRLSIYLNNKGRHEASDVELHIV